MTDPRETRVLAVDDNAANLLAIEAALQPADFSVVTADSGPEALKHLLQREFAVILLDVQMPGMDGFELAAALQDHPRTANIPVIFLTAISRDATHVFQGYRLGAVDYLLKPFDPALLRAKVKVFVELRRKEAKIREQAALLHQHEIEALQRRSDERYLELAESVPLPMWRVLPDGTVLASNRAWHEYAQVTREQTRAVGLTTLVEPDDADAMQASWLAGVATGQPFHVDCRLRRADGARRWHLVRAVPAGDGWLVTATDNDAQRRAHDLERFLGEVSEVLTSSFDLPRTLGAVARLVVGNLAEWCAVDLIDGEGTSRVAFAHRSGSDLVPGKREADLSVSLKAHGRVRGLITLGTAPERSFSPADLKVAEDLASRAAMAVANAQLYRSMQEARDRAEFLAAEVTEQCRLVDQALTDERGRRREAEERLARQVARS